MKLDLYSKKSQLDEMQEQTLKKIESRGFWAMWTGTLAALIIQQFMGAAPRQTAGEWIVFMIGSAYVAISCMRKGIWDRHIKANLVTNSLLSIVAGITVGFINYFQYGLAEGAAFSGVFTCLLCVAALQLACRFTRKRRKKLDGAGDGEVTE